MSTKPNIVVILCDDMGYSDPGCFGGEIATPNIDSLASHGAQYTNFYVTPRCAPSRASLLTGMYPHQAGIGILTYNDGPAGYPGNLRANCPTVAQILEKYGYKSYLSGKWHLSNNNSTPNGNWPLQRGFHRFYGTLAGSGSFYHPRTLMRDNENIEHEVSEGGFYYTDKITENAVTFMRDHFKNHPGQPFFGYFAYTAPHWPLHAHKEHIDSFKGKFDEGWDILREKRIQRQIEKGILPRESLGKFVDDEAPRWQDADDKEWRKRCMEVYAAQIRSLDEGVGAILKTLEENGELENTCVFFLSDNGGCNEVIKPHPTPGVDLSIFVSHTIHGEPVMLGNHPDIMPGGENTFQTYSDWAYLSNSPFRLYKSWAHEGGIASPLLVRFGKSADVRGIQAAPGQLNDILPTILALTGAEYPDTFGGEKTFPLEGISLTAAAKNDRELYFEHQGNCAVRCGKWKLVKEYAKAWELYDLESDRTETNDVSGNNMQIVHDMILKYYHWARRSDVIPRENILSIPGRITHPNQYFGWMI